MVDLGIFVYLLFLIIICVYFVFGFVLGFEDINVNKIFKIYFYGVGILMGEISI